MSFLKDFFLLSHHDGCRTGDDDGGFNSLLLFKNIFCSCHMMMMMVILVVLDGLKTQNCNCHCFLRIFCCSCHDPDRLSFEPLKAFLRPHSDANLYLSCAFITFVSLWSHFWFFLSKLNFFIFVFVHLLCPQYDSTLGIHLARFHVTFLDIKETVLFAKAGHPDISSLAGFHPHDKLWHRSFLTYRCNCRSNTLSSSCHWFF